MKTTVKSLDRIVDTMSMRAMSKFLSHTLLSVAGLLLLTMQFSCNTGPLVDLNPDDNYRIEGVLVRDMNTNTASIRVQFYRNDTVVADANIVVDNDSLLLAIDSAYFGAVRTDSEYAFGNYSFVVNDSGMFADTLLMSVPDTFSIMQASPASKIKAGNPVSLEWFGSAGAAGYVIAAVKRGAGYLGTGYSEYSSTGTQAGFPDSAFYGINNQFDSGMYDLTAYAYFGSPDSSLSSELLPVPMPNQLADNITVPNLMGRFGVIVVCRFDSMYVNLQ